ncbi:hypothetical protein [Vampirovibrio sp.]|uniref:hypothetical protein n=1 Tax=Vampirovibrio sp. TaxID=2717857 RepID=UPI003592F134
MSYLPPNPYAPMPQAFPPQAGPAFPPAMANPMGAPGGMMPGGMDPMAALQGMGGFPGAAAVGAGMGQDSFGPQPGIPGGPGGMQAPPAQAQQPGVFQHQSGGFADKNTTLSNGSFWTSWKGLSTIGVGAIGTAYAIWALLKGSLTPWKAPAAQKAFSELGTDIQAKVKELPDNAKNALENLKSKITKANADAEYKTFEETFKFVDEDLTELASDKLTKVKDLKTAYTEHGETIKKGVSEGKKVADIDGKEATKKIEAAEAAFAKEADFVKAPPAANTPAATQAEGNAANTPAATQAEGNAANTGTKDGWFRSGLNWATRKNKS